MNEQIDETKAPSLLPNVLPAGTEFYYLGSKDHGLTAHTALTLVNGAMYRGTFSNPPDAQCGLSNDDAMVSVEFVYWPSYYVALRSAPESREFKAGDRVSGTTRPDSLVGAMPIDGTVSSVAERAATFPAGTVFVRSRGSNVACDPASLRHEPAQAEAKAPGPCDCRCSRDRSCGAHEPDCALVAARIAAKDNDLGWGGTRAKPVEPARVDPYVAHRLSRPQESWQTVSLDRRISDAKAKHLADFDRPLRTGPLKNRDRYGQLLSARGWETED